MSTDDRPPPSRRDRTRPARRPRPGQEPHPGHRPLEPGEAGPATRRRPAYGGPAKASGAFPDERDPQLLDVTVGRLVDDHGWDVDLRVAGMFARWPELVGEEVAQHATPESFADGTLVVRTDSTAWATQLKLLAPAVVRRLNEDLGHGTVTLIEVLGPAPAELEEGPRSVRDGRGPRDTYG